MQTVFRIDGRSYNVIVESLQRDFQVLDSDKSGRTLSGVMNRDIIGTYYNYTLELDAKRLSASDYDSLYETISDPCQKYHTITMPYGQTTISFRAYVTAGSDKLKITDKGNVWSGLSIQFIARSPYRRA